MTQKTVRYIVYSADDDYIGEWTDVTSEPTFKRQINNALSSMDVEFARNELTSKTLTDTLDTEADVAITDESDAPLLIDLIAEVGLGVGTDLDLNYNIEVITHYGTYDTLDDEADVPITDESDKPLEIPDGLPDGLTIFTGYVSDWEIDIGGSDTLKASLLSHSVELNNIILMDGTDTKVTYNSYDPSNIAKAVIDYAITQGARIHYDSTSIELTGTTVSYTFNLNTIAECLDQVLKLCPGDWYWTYNPGDNLYSLKARPASRSRWFTKLTDVFVANFRKSIAHIANKVYFTGGGEPALLVVRNDAASQAAWRTGITKLSDQRVVVQSTAEIMADAEIERYTNPSFVGTTTITGDHYDPIESIALGEIVGFSNFGEYIDENIELQIVGIDYKVDTVDLELDRILPPVAKRIEDIRRNLDELAQENNPNAPL